MNDQRPNPDELLARVQAEERRTTRGQLKIFLGYAAGVGKTYAMLEAARVRKATGVDLVVAYVETHGRAETEALLAGCEIIPPHSVEYRGIALPEMNLDAVLARHPQVALVDELAHTNVPGSRHPKRYLDVEELLAAGIDVYTTLNIQHLESLNDVVAQITGVTVRETLPDKVIDEASEIELIDLPPDELVQRLREGKVYVPQQAARAIDEFFRKGNLTALRELALRRTAKRVDDQMRDYMRTRSIPGPWPANDRILVCVSAHPLSERLVRAARRMADQLGVEWFVLNVETPGYSRLSPAQSDQLARTMRLAEELGARARSLPGNSVVETVLAYAHRHNITKLIVGKSLQPRWIELLRGSTVDQLLRQSGGIDVYVINSEPDTQPRSLARSGWVPHRPLWRYGQSLLLVAATTAIGALIDPLVTAQTNLVMIYLAAAVIAALYLGRGPSLLAALLSVLAFDFFFVPPRYTFSVSDTEYVLTFLGLFIVSLVISTMAVGAKEQAEAAREREAQTATLYAFSSALAAAASLDEIVSQIVMQLGENFSREIVVLLPENQHLTVSGHSPDIHLDDSELAVATWAYQHGQAAGRDTDTLPAANVRYLPLKTAHGVIGVLGVMPHDSTRHLTPDQRRLMEVYASQAAVAIERAQLAEQTRQTQVLQATEKLQTALLNSISHDLRTPLVSITGALSSLQEESVLSEAARHSLIDTARGEAERLNRLVGNLLDMTRLEAGALRIKQELCDIQDVIGSVFERLGEQVADRVVTFEGVPDLPLIPMDFVLIVQVLVNLLDNALKYSPPDSPIEISATYVGAFAEIAVADRGPGIPPADLTRVFDKFYRVQNPNNVSGTGLGLSICKGIVEAHGGFIGAENRSGGGTIVTVGLPLARRSEVDHD
ncbi:MAG: sensor histidine kinase KdpD [Thermoflexales bacterium]|nr:sensor histidine kinase KdpD [Thermoflexales bacterium]